MAPSEGERDEHNSRNTAGNATGIKKVCDWCREPIRIDALKCPHCHKWRNDIQEDINKNNRWAICTVVYFVIAFIFVVIGARSGIWAETTGWGSIAGVLNGSAPSSSFSLELFLSSLPGWVILFCIAGFIISSVKTNQYGKSAKRKAGGSLHEI